MADVKNESKNSCLDTIQRGYRYFIDKDYTGAITAFTEVIENNHTDETIFNALDCRAASYEKLNDLQRALRDGKAMIKKMPKSSKGYLRTGKVLCLKDQKDLALKIYERGLEKVKFDAVKEIVALRSMHHKLKVELHPEMNYDFLNYLPLELIQMVFQQLKMSNLVICLRVSKKWKRLLESLHSLWTTIDISHTLRPLSMKSLKVHIRRSQYTLTRALLSLKFSKDESKIKFILDSCKCLKDLQIYGNGLLGNTLENILPTHNKIENLYVSRMTQITLSAAKVALMNCQNNLVEASLLNVRGSGLGLSTGVWPRLDALRSITLKSSAATVLDLDKLILATPNIRTVVLNNWQVMPRGILDLRPWSYLERLDLFDTQLIRFPKLPPTIKYLILDDNLQLHLSVNEEKEVFQLPLLELFSCQSTFIESRGLLAITQSSIEAKNLKSLYIGGRLNAVTTNFPVSEEFPTSPTVEDLSIAFLHLKDERVLEILELYPRLKKVNLSGTHITGVTIKALVEKNVKRIIVNECHNISLDAVEMARGKGVSVIFNFSTDLRPSRFLNISNIQN